MWKNSKVRICILILLFIPSKLLFAESLDQNSNFITAKNYYDLMVPEKINISIIGKEYIKYLKQIRDVGEKQNLNSSVINFHKKKWIDAKIKSEILDDNQINIEIILHGDFNDHISLPYSSLRAKVKSKFFYQLKNFILFKPKTRRYEAEIFGILFFKNIGILSPFSRYIKLTINDNLPEDYIFQEKITKYLIERKGFREEPILEYDEKNKWNKYILNKPHIESANFFKLENGNYSNDIKNIDKIFYAATLKQFEIKKTNISNDLFESSMLIMGGCHGLAAHNRKYYFDSLNDRFLPTYYDGLLFYDKSNNLCEIERKDYQIKLSLNNYEILKKIIKDKSFKLNLKKEYLELTNKKKNSIQFDYFWNQIEKNLDKYKITIEKDLNKNIKRIYSKDIFFEKKLIKLNLPYPTVYFYKDIKNKDYKICYNWFDLSSKVYLMNSKNKIYKKDQGCKKIKKKYVKDLLKSKIFFKTNLNDKIKIYPILIGNVYDEKLYINNQNPEVKSIFIKENIENKKIDLEANTILLVNIASKVSIKNLIVNSSDDNNSSLILNLNGTTIENLEFNQQNKSKKTHNQNIENRNVTGCINIFDSSFIINQIKINGSNCEDGLNVVRSTGIIKNISVVDTISDGVDFDYSDIKVKNSTFNNIGGDCIDLSFGLYTFKNSQIDICGDKGISVGENTKAEVLDTFINNTVIGIASKDNSRVKINNLTINNTEKCLSAYNKKSEFSGGYIEYRNFECKNYLKDITFDSQSIIHDKIIPTNN